MIENYLRMNKNKYAYIQFLKIEIKVKISKKCAIWCFLEFFRRIHNKLWIWIPSFDQYKSFIPSSLSLDLPRCLNLKHCLFFCLQRSNAIEWICLFDWYNNLFEQSSIFWKDFFFIFIFLFLFVFLLQFVIGIGLIGLMISNEFPISIFIFCFLV